MFSRHVDGVVVALSWKRTMVIEQGRWKFRDTDWKPWGDNIRNLRTLQGVESVRVRQGKGEGYRGHMADQKHTHFQYEEFVVRDQTECTEEGTGTEDVRWPGHVLGPDERLFKRIATYHARFSVGNNSGGVEYMAELDEGTWRTLKVGLRCRLKLGAFSDEVKHVIPVHD